MAVEHYENFPVASWLCPPRLRPPIAAIYWFARTADDIADEGDDAASQRMADLLAYRADLLAISIGQPHSERWAHVFAPLARALTEFALPVQHLADLLSAFEQDVVKTRDHTGYADRAELLAYCRRSANPVGRLLLHLYGVNDAEALAQSDQICTALQLINFWQDLGVDIPRGRHYLPEHDRLAHGVAKTDLMALRPTSSTMLLIADEVVWTRAMMQKGSPLVKKIPGRAGWELRLVVQAGLLMLEKIEALSCNTLHSRPQIGTWDAPLLLWRALRM